MLEPRSRATEAQVAAHYDVLDRFYASLWGEHVHHGLWSTAGESPREAARALTDRVLHALGPLPAGAVVADAGCGYGGTARVLAHERGARVEGFTLSRAQAEAFAPHPDGVRLHVRSWLRNGLADASCAAALSIEALSHMDDKPLAFAELARVVAPGGRVVVVDWLHGERLGWASRELLARPMARESRLPSLHAASEYVRFAADAGLVLREEDDLSRRVRRTWLVVPRRLGRLVLTDRDARRALLGPSNPDRAFALSMARLPIGYTTGALRLVLLAFERR